MNKQLLASHVAIAAYGRRLSFEEQSFLVGSRYLIEEYTLREGVADFGMACPMPCNRLSLD
jgi:hypothetical protein